MGKCLVTKLQEVVNNESLPVLGKWVITVAPGTFQFIIFSTVVDTLTFNNSIDDIYVGPTKVSSGWKSNANSAFRVHGTLTQETKFFVDNAYSSTEFEISSGIYREIKCPNLKFVPLTSIKVAESATVPTFVSAVPESLVYMQSYGSSTNKSCNGFDLTTLPDTSNFSFFGMSNANIKGPLSIFNNAIILTNLGLQRNPEVTGSVESFIEAQLANGRTTNMDTLDFRYTNVTLNNKKIESITTSQSFKVNMTSTGCDILLFTDDTVVASYNRNTNTWTYNS